MKGDFPEVPFDRFNVNPDGSINASVDLSVAAIGMGDAPNFHASMRMQVTQNANGDVTMEKEFTSATCD